MIKVSLMYLKKIIDWLNIIYFRYKEKPHSKLTYHSLAPTKNAENIEHYVESLEWALENRKEIKNIAISGPYGSGRSSVLKTFQERNLYSEFNFLNISLATFKEEKIIDNEDKDSEKNLRLIELSILQQLFYLENDSKIPDLRKLKVKV